MHLNCNFLTIVASFNLGSTWAMVETLLYKSQHTAKCCENLSLCDYLDTFLGTGHARVRNLDLRVQSVLASKSVGAKVVSQRSANSCTRANAFPE